MIAKQLGLSEGTVKAHVSAIFQILGARNRAEAVIIAAKSGIKVMYGARFDTAPCASRSKPS